MAKTRSPEEVTEDVNDEELEESVMGGFYKFAQVRPVSMHMLYELVRCATSKH